MRACLGLWLPVFLLCACCARGSTTARADEVRLAESTELLLPADQKKFETGDEQRARQPKQRRKKHRKGKKQPPKKPAPPRDPPNSGNFDGDGVEVDHTH